MVSAATAADGPAVPLRPWGVAELLDSAVRVVRHTPRATFAISLPFAVVRTALVALITYAATDGSTSGTGTTDTALTLPALLAQLFLASVFGTALTGLLAPLYTEHVLGRRIGAHEAMRRVGRSALPLAGLVLVVAVVLEVGTVALAVGGVWLWGVWALGAPALVIERRGPLRALGRSFDLVRGGFWRVWGVRALRWVVTTVLGAFLTLPFTALAAVVGDANPFDADGGIGNVGAYVTVAALGGVVSQLLLGPVAAAVDTLLYLDARMRREGLDIVIALESDDGRRDAVPRPAAAW
ncbi:hypothetical protein SAMN05443575_1048 [Jatrophihabitans endophyticus]|uniref:Membrane domain of glycerophosphoryl diester phosphodiesterase n=1 Tax=Jatrophihabitans endophyticus TaxID=1206085 RepID=A0A1M5EYF9_9ACTN|nr:hypothetical protein [Jatrophihabitans endophyticus]SHF84303.1 hypothetical protein SAMN05443575_1048 [Jatrophihabitans endophyticus]